MRVSPDFQEVTTTRGVLTESVRWVGESSCFQWVDILQGRLCRWRPDSSEVEERTFAPPLACAIPLDGTRSVLAFEKSLSIYDWDAGSLKPWVELPVIAGTRLNDGGLAPDGSVWIGSMSELGTPGLGRLWRVGIDSSVSTVLSDVAISNGIGWLDQDRAAYVDTVTNRVDVISRQTNNQWSRTVLAEFESQGSPDGLLVGPDGDVWVAMWDGGRVIRLGASGDLLAEVTVPAPRCTSVAIGGPNNDLMVVTTASWGLDRAVVASSPSSGHVLAARIPTM